MLELEHIDNKNDIEKSITKSLTFGTYTSAGLTSLLTVFEHPPTSVVR